MSQQTDVENRLREMILNLDISPGERITERWAEAAFGASRTPVRAAFIRLANEGLLRREGRGWMTAPVEPEEIRQLFDYREALEVSALRMAEGKISQDQLQSLAGLLEIDNPSASKEELSRTGTEFHLALAGLAGNKFLTESLKDVLQQLSRARWLDSGSEQPAWEEHRVLVNVLKQDDFETASSLISAHIRSSRDRTINALTRNQRTLRARGVKLS
ncbi:GntR family transcriptional regulator [Pantoea cypripedii]|uniref:GntR family transcriptional regulator n=1 Tax=Pantoea cypripedii TaxID=55209 RepID=A0A1X1EM31_PANCY|nr:GntR family transcriptional regulator [Pantoea cypripedii]MBP2198730.1 DNA-binding GntR family transcriptional regulator [Pantoea cypripedii]ORM89936.1 GntR family transcriptional regulator [Pantoea cypripedii]